MNTLETPRKLGDVSAVADRLSCHKATVWRQVATGNLPQPIRIGGRTLWDIGEIDALIEQKMEEREVA